MLKHFIFLVLILGSISFIQVTGQDPTSPEPAVSTDSPSNSSTTTKSPSPVGGDTCYQLTWLGALDMRFYNDTKSCDDVETAIKPCHAPLVWTKDEYAVNHPNITQLEERCQDPCKTTCTRTSSQVCVKYALERDGLVTYFSSYCGTGVLDSQDGEPIRNGCFTQPNIVTGQDLTVCFCDGHLCNSTVRKQSYISYVFFFVFAARWFS